MVEAGELVKISRSLWPRTLPIRAEDAELRRFHPIEGSLKIIARRAGIKLTALTMHDAEKLPALLNTSEYRGESLTRSPYHYGFAPGFFRQAARDAARPLFGHVEKGGRRGFFLLTTVGKGKPPFVILSPTGQIAPELMRFGRGIANAFQTYVVIKKPEIELEGILSSRGWGDYRKGHGWSGKTRRDDDTYRSQVVLVDTIVNPRGKTASMIRKKLHNFENGLEERYGKGAKLVVHKYDPDAHSKHAAEVVKQWGNELIVRAREKADLKEIEAKAIKRGLRLSEQELRSKLTDSKKREIGERPLTKEEERMRDSAIAAHKVFLKIKPDFHNLYSYMLYIRIADGALLPFAFTSFEKTGYFERDSVQKIKASLPPEYVRRPDSFDEINRYVKATRNEGLGPGEYTHTCFAMTANVALTSMARQAGYMTILHSLKQLPTEKEIRAGGERLPIALINLGGSETRGLMRFKRGFDPVFELKNWHLVLYPSLPVRERTVAAFKRGKRIARVIKWRLTGRRGFKLATELFRRLKER